MNIAVLGTGDVGRTMATALIKQGHTVMMGSRTADNPAARAWAESQGESARQGTFDDAAAFADLVFNCTAGMHSLAVIDSINKDHLNGKVLVDVANPLDFSNGFPPRLTVCNDDSLGEQIQRVLPDVRVVKAFNTLANAMMVEPARLEGPHQLLVSGNDADAKEKVREIAASFGWQHEQWLDLGGIEQARGTEMYLALWVRLYNALQTPEFNLILARSRA
ncbi:NADP oxidoreductase [Natronospirillum operosum]|uniref:NADP oxidoreductase n=1 Tax=Natronospirillum operosum TaxID=2759953 RepID=A0A4Z0WCY1_9GAMM|nr:NAD(P)-binding domain-containing protein [Natronospirillum operosum]TGG92860.1 NADP oxidoreductase [Natronospirillum operosum]